MEEKSTRAKHGNNRFARSTTTADSYRPLSQNTTMAIEQDKETVDLNHSEFQKAEQVVLAMESEKV